MERFSFLFFVCTAPGFSFFLAPPLHAGHPQVSVPRPDIRGLKQLLIRVLLLTQARGREGYSHRNWNAGPACGGRGRRDVATASGAPCVLPGKLSLGHRILAVAGCKGSGWGGCVCVDSDLCLHTGFLVAAAAAALAFHAHLWGPS